MDTEQSTLVGEPKTVLDDLVDAAEREAATLEAQALQTWHTAEGSTDSWLRKTWNAIAGIFIPRAQATVDDLHEEIEALADTLDARVDDLLAMGHRKKLEAQDEIAALSRRISTIDAEIERTLDLGKRASALQQVVRSGRQDS